MKPVMVSYMARAFAGSGSVCRGRASSSMIRSQDALTVISWGSSMGRLTTELCRVPTSAVMAVTSPGVILPDKSCHAHQRSVTIYPAEESREMPERVSRLMFRCFLRTTQRSSRVWSVRFSTSRAISRAWTTISLLMDSWRKPLTRPDAALDSLLSRFSTFRMRLAMPRARSPQTTKAMVKTGVIRISAENAPSSDTTMVTREVVMVLTAP